MMKEKPIQKECFGAQVWASAMDSERAKECLCFNCATLNAGKKNKCKTADKIYQICKDDDMAMMITRCKEWTPFDVKPLEEV